MPLAAQLTKNYPLLAEVKSPTVTLTSPPVLDSSMCREFWETAQRVRGSEIKVVIDLQETASIHESGYLLLKMLKDSVAKGRAELLLLHCPSHLKKALRTRGFESYFTIL